MKHLPATLLVLAVGWFAGASASAAEPANPPPAKAAEKSKEKSAPAPTPAPQPATATPPAAAPEGVQGLEREFGERSKDLIEKRKVLLERLRLAKTDDEKQKIIAELRQQQQERVEQQRELARQIREQMQNRRSDARSAGPGG